MDEDAGEKKSSTDVLKAQLAALEAEAKSLGIDTNALPDQALSAGTRGGYRGRGGHRGRAAYVPRGRGGYRGRGGAPFGGAAGGGVMRLDNRPKSISLTGVDFSNAEKEESLRQYLLVCRNFLTFLASISHPLRRKSSLHVDTDYHTGSRTTNIPPDNIRGYNNNVQRTLRSRDFHVQNTRQRHPRRRKSRYGVGQDCSCTCFHHSIINYR